MRLGQRTAWTAILSAITLICSTPLFAASSAGSQLPIVFEPNLGQAPAEAQYLLRGGVLEGDFEKDGFRLSLPNSEKITQQLKMRLVGSREDTAITSEDRLPGHTNYLMGDDPKQWLRGVPNYSHVRYRQVYPGTDLLFYGNSGSLEHDFEVRPGADPGRIAFQLDGADSVSIEASTAKPAFDVGLVKPSQRVVGPDFNNQFTYSPTGVRGRNVTLQRLIAEAYQLQLNQILGPSWLDKNEYDIDVRSSEVGTREEHALMLRSLVAERFNVKEHREMREMRVYALVTSKSGSKIRPIRDGETPTAGAGFHFHGDLRQFADLLSVQLSIPAPDNPAEPARASASPISVLDKTELPGVFDFSVDIHPEPGTDMFASWQRVLGEQLGLRIESRKENVAVFVVDEAARIPTEN